MIEMCTKVHEFMKGHEMVCFFNDLREMKGTFTSLTKWLFENMKDMLGLGLKYDTLVPSNDVFTEFVAAYFAKIR